MFKTALVVDDSRTAQVTLGRLLKAQGLLVDMAESGPEALDYLRLNPPPVAIFLDHMMPGMDGFETLGMIKANQATAAIPVVMYTSQEDDAYFGQARALGAAAVLPKPPQSENVDRVLAALNLSGSVAVPPASLDVAPAPPAALADTTLTPAVPAGGGYDTSVSPPPVPASAQKPDAARSDAGSRAWVAPLVMSIMLLSAAAAWWLLTGYQDAMSARDAALAERDRLHGDLARAMEKLKAKLAPAPTPVNQALLDTLAWAINQNGRYDFDEIPLDDKRLELLRGLVKRLAAAGFRGTVRVDTHLGEFCLVRDGQGQYHLPPVGTPVSGCEVVSYPPGEAGRLAQRKSEAFSRYLDERTESGAPIDIVVVSHGSSQPLQNPHDAANITTASEWNALARLNQRVEISIVSKAPER